VKWRGSQMPGRRSAGLDELMIVNPGSPEATPQMIRIRPHERETQQEAVMAKVEGIREKVHLPIYDSIFVPPPPVTGTAPTLATTMADPRVIRYFVDVQNKTKLETNMQSAGQLSSSNSYEARSIRVIVSSLQPRKEDSKPEKLKQLWNEPEFVAALIYNSVTVFYVGEKVMIEAPTFMFPSGAGVFSGFPTTAGHGVPSPTDTFRFAEPVTIEPQQNFRVEIQFPRDIPEQVATAIGPLRIWVVLDGYMVRDVQ